MKKFGVILCVILCGIILTFSYASWKEKLSAAGKPAEQEVAAETVEETEKETIEESAPSIELDLDSLTASMDPQVKEIFFNRKEQDEKVQLLVVGSDAMEFGEPGYGELLVSALEETYGDFVETELFSFDGTSQEFLASGPQLSAGYDVVLMEPFTLKNNGIVEIEVEHEHIESVFGEVLSSESDAVLVLQPPQPIYGAQYYRTQVTALEEFAGMRNYAYINHWEQWPSSEDLTLKDYLTEESNPNQRGAETWADALIAYFTGS